MTTIDSDRKPTPEARTKPGIEFARLRVRDLIPHPRHAELFGPRTPAENQMIADSMLARGQDTPIDVLPDRQTIIAGRGRHAAAILNTWEFLDARVRHDLAAAGELAIEAFLIGDNLHRRHSSQLERARCAKRLLEIAEVQQSAMPGRRRQLTAHDAQRRVGELLAIGDRQVRRLLRVLETPPEVQAAFEAGKLHIDLAGKVASLDKKTQAYIADDIATGGDPKEVINDHITQRDVKRGERWALYKIVDYLNGGLRLLEVMKKHGGAATQSEGSLTQEAKNLTTLLADRLDEFRDTGTTARG